jgi:hypothetical protein
LRRLAATHLVLIAARRLGWENEMTSAEETSRLSAVLRTTFGTMIFIAWGIETILWVYSAIHILVVDGDSGPIIRAVCAVLLMTLLAGMEGLEVAVIDRWRELFAGRPSSAYPGWIAARQLFVALILPAVTLLAEPDLIAIPFSSTVITGGFVLNVFTFTWPGLTVLWFMQILPKHLGATNPDRYLRHTRSSLFPLVDIVRQSGISLPAVWVASAVESRLDWEAIEPGIEEEAIARRGGSLAEPWAALVPERAPTARRRPPDDDGAAGPTGS